MKTLVRSVLFASLVSLVGVYADSITHSNTTINIDFIDIGFTNNSADTTGYGAVGYNYRMGKFEVTVDQWSTVIAADSNVGDVGSWNSGLPTASSSWYEAARFANWLTSGDAYSGAYQFDDGGALTNVNRAVALSTYGTVYVLPTEDEWYKAAYLKSDGSGYTFYTTGDSVPSGALANYDVSGLGTPWAVGTSGIAENNGTFDMNGNVWEWNESAFDGTLDNMTEGRAYRGGAFDSSESTLDSSFRGSHFPPIEVNSLGFRVVEIVAVPAPPINVSIFNAVEIGWTSVSGSTYQVQYSTNLVSSNWFDLGTSVVGEGSTNYVFDSTRGSEERFYRVITE